MDVKLTLVVRDGAVLALTAAAIIMGALRLNPWLFLRHFPAAVKASQPPLSAGEKAAGRCLPGSLRPKCRPTMRATRADLRSAPCFAPSSAFSPH